MAEGGFKMSGLILLDGFNPGLSGGKRVETRAGRGVDRTGGGENAATSARAAQTGRCDG